MPEDLRNTIANDALHILDSFNTVNSNKYISQPMLSCFDVLLMILISEPAPHHHDHNE